MSDKRKLSSKEKNLISEIKRRKIFYEDEMTNSQRDIARRLHKEGYIIQRHGSWSGLPYYEVREWGGLPELAKGASLLRSA